LPLALWIQGQSGINRFGHGEREDEVVVEHGVAAAGGEQRDQVVALAAARTGSPQTGAPRQRIRQRGRGLRAGPGKMIAQPGPAFRTHVLGRESGGGAELCQHRGVGLLIRRDARIIDHDDANRGASAAARRERSQ
jgi:hypothetical protein